MPPSIPWSIEVENEIGTFSAGELVLIIRNDQYQSNTANCATAGRSYEFHRIQYLTNSGKNLHFVDDIALLSSTDDLQVIKVLEFSNGSIEGYLTTTAFDASDGHGGVLVFLVNDALTFGNNGIVSVNGLGLLGGIGGEGGSPLEAIGQPGQAGDTLNANGTSAGLYLDVKGGLGQKINLAGCDSVPRKAGKGGYSGKNPDNYTLGTTGLSPEQTCIDDYANNILTFGNGGKGGDGGKFGATAGGHGGGGGANMKYHGSTGIDSNNTAGPGDGGLGLE